MGSQPGRGPPVHLGHHVAVLQHTSKIRLKYAGRFSDDDEDRAAGRDVEFERELAGSAELRGLVEAADDAAGDERLQPLSGPIGAAPVHPDQVLFSATGASPQPDNASVLTCVVGTAGTVAIG